MTDNRGLLSYDTLVHAISGATGSVVGMAAFYPLDTVRCRLQLEETQDNALPSTSSAHPNGQANGNGYANGNSHHQNGNGIHQIRNGIQKNGNGISLNGGKHAAVLKYSGILGASTWRTLQRLVATEGITGLYRGVVPVLQSLCASNFVYFYTFHGLRSAWGARTLDGVRTQSAGRDLMLAAIAGAVNVMVTTPLWVVNTRLKISGTPYNNLLDGLRHVAREEGFRGLWAGAAPSLLLVTNPAMQFMVYEYLKRRLAPTGRQLSALTSLFVGATAKAVATILTYPLQMAQARLRHRGARGPGKGATLPLLLDLVKQKGVLGLYRGLEAKLLQTVLTAALMFATYEKIARFVFSLMRRNKILIKH